MEASSAAAATVAAKLEALRGRLQGEASIRALDSMRDAAGFSRLVESIADQIAYLRASVQNTFAKGENLYTYIGILLTFDFFSLPLFKIIK